MPPEQEFSMDQQEEARQKALRIAKNLAKTMFLGAVVIQDGIITHEEFEAVVHMQMSWYQSMPKDEAIKEIAEDPPL